MMNVDVLMFDLDGTLVNTIEPIARSCNKALSSLSYEIYDVDKYYNFIGKGIKVVFERIAKLQNIKEDDIDKLVQIQREVYIKDFLTGAYLYEGIEELLDKLVENNIDICIVTNKDENIAKLYVETILSKWKFKYVYGSLDNRPNKPNPYTVNLIKNNYESDKLFFVGDMQVDIDTIKNANIRGVYCSWGFSKLNQEEIPTVNHPLEILEYIC